MPFQSRQTSGRAAGFTLVELLLAMALLILIAALVSQAAQQTGEVWQRASGRIQAFQEARAAFESMNRTLAQATLNGYHDYYDAMNRPRASFSTAERASFVPAAYGRCSDLHFICGRAATLLAAAPLRTQGHAVFFQAPLGRSATHDSLRGALNACGYFIDFGSDDAFVPAPVRESPGHLPRYRFRLMEMVQRTERLGVYESGPGAGRDWFANHARASSRVLAENVVLLVLLPLLPAYEDHPSAAGLGVSLAPCYQFNSRVPRGGLEDPAWLGASPPFPGDAFLAHPGPAHPARPSSRHHQLPPLMRVILVVIDESSARQIQGDSADLPRALDLDGAGLFRNAGSLEADLRAVEDICNAEPGNPTQNTLRLNYRVFTTDLMMREARWSAL